PRTRGRGVHTKGDDPPGRTTGSVRLGGWRAHAQTTSPARGAGAKDRAARHPGTIGAAHEWGDRPRRRDRRPHGAPRRDTHEARCAPQGEGAMIVKPVALFVGPLKVSSMVRGIVVAFA